MPLFDMPLEKLKKYKPAAAEPENFDRFWKQTLKDAAAFSLDATFNRLDDPFYKLVDAYDVTFNGFGGQPVKGWFIRPAGGNACLPCVISYVGYGGGRSFALDHLGFAVAGIAEFIMDTRGQGSSWAHGDTPDDAPSGPQYPGFMTKGIESPDHYYYRRVFVDAARAIEAAAEAPGVDAARIGLSGASQGGGITIAAAALARDKVKLCMPDVPFLCHYRRACELIDTMPYVEISNFLKMHRGRTDEVFHTLSYFDGVNFAKRITARCLFSVALMDTTCPPSTVYAAYNNVKAPKAIRIYDFNNHEGGSQFQFIEKLRFAMKHL